MPPRPCAGRDLRDRVVVLRTADLAAQLARLRIGDPRATDRVTGLRAGPDLASHLEVGGAPRPAIRPVELPGAGAQAVFHHAGRLEIAGVLEVQPRARLAIVAHVAAREQ